MSVSSSTDSQGSSVAAVPLTTPSLTQPETTTRAAAAVSALWNMLSPSKAATTVGNAAKTVYDRLPSFRISEIIRGKKAPATEGNTSLQESYLQLPSVSVEIRLDVIAKQLGAAHDAKKKLTLEFSKLVKAAAYLDALAKAATLVAKSSGVSQEELDHLKSEVAALSQALEDLKPVLKDFQETQAGFKLDAVLAGLKKIKFSEDYISAIKALKAEPQDEQLREFNTSVDDYALATEKLKRQFSTVSQQIEAQLKTINSLLIQLEVLTGQKNGDGLFFSATKLKVTKEANGESVEEYVAKAEAFTKLEEIVALHEKIRVSSIIGESVETIKAKFSEKVNELAAQELKAESQEEAPKQSALKAAVVKAIAEKAEERVKTLKATV